VGTISIVSARAMRAIVCAAAAWAMVLVGLTHLATPSLVGAPAGVAAPTRALAAPALQSLPLTAQSAISGTLGSADPRFDARRSGTGWQLRGGGVRAGFGSGPVRLDAAAGTVSMSLAGASGPWTAHGNRVTRFAGPVREWYAAGPLGIEQGFTVSRHPRAGAGRRLTLALSVSGSLAARAGRSQLRFISRAGRVGVLYGGLQARDAGGRRLAATLSLRHGRVVIGVDDRGARYPVTIDPLVQQGAKLTPSDESGPGAVGISVALSSDGNTALVGGDSDNRANGAAWVFTRSGGNWTQQGPKLTAGGAPADAAAAFGSSVALSGDGNTALIGGDFDGAAGAAWVFTRSGSTWTQQGSKLVGTGATGGAGFGSSVALSASGNTALVGGPNSGSGNVGAAWAFSRGSGGTWSPLGSTLAATGESPAGEFGTSVALSSDGVTALVGGSNDSGGTGSAWTFVLNSGSYTQQAKLSPSDAAGTHAAFGTSVALSSDGNTALVGGPGDGTQGAAWVFTRTLSIWSQQGLKLTAGDAATGSGLGSGVALSSDGNVALIGGKGDAGGDGAAWLFGRAGSTWAQQGSKLTGQGENLVGTFGQSVALAADGQTALIGGNNDSSGAGAAWAFAPPAPTCANASSATPAGGGAVTVSLPCSGPAGAALSYAIVSGPGQGSLGPVGAGGQVRYSSRSGYVGADAFTYRVTDQWGVSNTATAAISVPSFAVPACTNVRVRGRKGATAVTVTLSCRGPAGLPMTYAIVTPPGNGRAAKINQSNGRVTYSTHVGFSGTDRFTYRATDVGGASAAATVTVVLPALGRITSTMTWGVFRAGPTSTILPGMVVKSLPGGATVRLSCTGKRCPVKTQSVSLAKQRTCHGKGKKRRCRLAVPKSGNLDLARLVHNKRVPVGSALVVSMIQSGAIGKEYVFRMVGGKQPSVKIQALAPGGTAPCPGC
jgi:FG-GAP repeat/Bacterial Ig domain